MIIKDLFYLSNSSSCLVADGRITELFCALRPLKDGSASVRPTLCLFLSRGMNRSKAKQHQAHCTTEYRSLPKHCRVYPVILVSLTQSVFDNSSSSSGKRCHN